MGKKMAGFSDFRRLPLPFYSVLEELIEENVMLLRGETG